MEELQILVDMVASLPQMALWVIIFFWIYKVFVIGSIYGVIRLAIIKMHDVLIAWKRRGEDIYPMLEKMTIHGTTAELITQLHRVRTNATPRYGNSAFVHDYHIEWLRKAIDNQIKLDNAEAAK